MTSLHFCKITLALTLFVLTTASGHAETAVAPHAESNTLSFQVWKANRIDEARANLEKAQQLTVQLVQPKASPRPEQKMIQLQANLDVAKELTINDYFVLYLSQFKNNREAFIDAAKKLTPEETADLMISYEKRLAGGGDGDEALTSTSVGEFGRASINSSQQNRLPNGLAPGPIHALSALQNL